MMVIALGNVTRSDDGVGPAVAARLATMAPELEVHIVDALGPEIAPVLAAVSQVVFVDAAPTGPPGFIRVERVADGRGTGTQIDDLTVGDVLALTRALYGRAPAAFQVTVAGETFEPGLRLSPRVAAAVAPTAAAVVALLCGSLRV